MFSPPLLGLLNLNYPIALLLRTGLVPIPRFVRRRRVLITLEIQKPNGTREEGNIPLEWIRAKGALLTLKVVHFFRLLSYSIGKLSIASHYLTVPLKLTIRRKIALTSANTLVLTKGTPHG